MREKCEGIFSGVVAQLGERYDGIVEVRGSTPLGSTKFSINNLRRLPTLCYKNLQLVRLGFHVFIYPHSFT